MNRMWERTSALALSVALLLVSMPGAGLAAGGGGGSGVPRGGHPDIRLGKVTRGQEAIDALGDRLPDVARAYGLSAAELARTLRSDSHARIDMRGRLFYQDAFDVPGGGSAEPQAADDAAETAGPATAFALAPLEDTFRLHSRPGAKRVIFLDFDGDLLSGTAWNSNNGGADIVCPPWDTDGGPSVFTDAERTRIQQVWQRVAEDYAPFDVDVTTEDPGGAAITRSSTTDEYYGTRVLVSPISSYFGNYGGIAYVGVFDHVGDYYKPALVFPEKLANGEKYVGEACSHECGHNLGLRHDGTTSGIEYYQGHGSGETGWAPIMGNGYYRNLTQWSKGEYPNANNTEDDFAVMAGNGLSPRPDDHGDSAMTASALPTGDVAVAGFIEGGSDVDVFAIDCGEGAMTVNVMPAERGPDLDVSAELRRGDGTLVASDNPVDTLSATIAATVSEGVYYLHVRGTGKDDPLAGYTAYASLGAYLVSADVVPPSGQTPPVAVASASPSSGEAPLAVTFDGFGSYDPDGVIVSYTWDFGDGTSASGAGASHTYSVAAVYSASLTVVDASGLADSAAVAITVAAPRPNTPPTAVALASPANGDAPLAVAFDGSRSSDADGRVVSWTWAFGDGTGASGSVVQHTYLSPGVYTAVLTVTDDSGATAVSSVAVQVTQAPAAYIRVASIQLLVSTIRGGKTATAVVRVTDERGMPVPGASVSGFWSGSLSGSSSGMSDADGNAVLVSRRFKKSGTVTFTVTGVTKTGYVYDPARNLVGSSSIAGGDGL